MGSFFDTQQEAHQLVGQAKRRATKIRLESVRGGIFAILPTPSYSATLALPPIETTLNCGI